MTDRLTTLLHDQAARLDVHLSSAAELRRGAQHKRMVRRSATVVLAVTVVVIVALVAGPNPFIGAHRTVPVGPTGKYPARFAGVPPVGATPSLPVDGRLVLDLEPEPGWSWSGSTWAVYADGRIIFQRISSTGQPLVIPDGADPFQTGYVQQRLTPQGVQLLLSRVLSIGQASGLFRQSMSLGNEAYETEQTAAWYQACNNGQLVHAQVLPPSIMQHPSNLETPAQASALAEIVALVADPSSVLPGSAWADRTIRPYIPSHYVLNWDRHGPDPSQLPSPAREALAQYEPLQPGRTITTDQARALLAAFAQSGVKLVGNHAKELDFNLPALGSTALQPMRNGLEVIPALPNWPALTGESGNC